MAVYLAKYFRSANGTLIKRMIPLFWQRGPGGTLETTFEIPSTDKHPFVALLSPFKSHGSFFLRARLSDVGKTQLPICRGCAMFANAKQRLKMRPHKLWRMDQLICFLAKTLAAFLHSAFLQLGSQLWNLCHYWTTEHWCLEDFWGKRGNIFTRDIKTRSVLMAAAVILIYADNDLLKDAECCEISGLSSWLEIREYVDLRGLKIIPNSETWAWQAILV